MNKADEAKRVCRPDAYVTVERSLWEQYKRLEGSTCIARRLLHVAIFYAGPEPSSYPLWRPGTLDVAHPLPEGRIPQGHANGEPLHYDETLGVRASRQAGRGRVAV